MDVRLPDGTVVRNVPEGTTQSELMRRLGRSEGAAPDPVAEDVAPSEQPPREATFIEGLSRAAFTRFVDNLLGVPGMIAQHDPGPLGMTMRGVSQIAGDAFDPTARPDAEAVLNPVRAAFQVGEEVPRAAMAGEPLDVMGRFQRAQEQQAEADPRFREEAPMGSAVGDVAGDVATVLTGRLPFARAMAGPPGASAAAIPRAQMAPGTRRAIQRVLDSRSMQRLARGVGRSLETGLEGAVLSTLREGDEVETAALAAGGQAAGSLALTLTTTKAGLVGLAATAAGFTALIQLGKSAIPGGRNRILESIETAFDKIKWSFALGALSGIAGAGRIRSGIGEDLPKVMDAVTAIPRGAALSVLTEWAKESDAGGTSIETVIGKISEDPEYFGAVPTRRLQRAMDNPNVSLKAEIDRLMKNRTFREKFNDLE